MTRYIPAFLAAATLLAAAAPTPAQTEHNAKWLGTWIRHADGCKVKLDIKPDVLRCTVTIEEGYAVSVEADYVVSKDGVLLGIVRGPKVQKASKKDKDDDDPVSKRLFYLQISADEKSLVVSDLNYGDNGEDKVKDVLEGKYHRTESKHTRAAAAPAMTLPSGSYEQYPSTRPGSSYLQHPPQYCPPATEPTPAKSKTDTKTRKAEPRISELLVPAGEPPPIEYYGQQRWFPNVPSQTTPPERVHGGIQ
jgi:hypothetical protein